MNFDPEILQCDPEILIFKNNYMLELIEEPENTVDSLLFEDNDPDLITDSKIKGVFGHLKDV